MAGIQDHDYLRVCARLAGALGISQASARRRVEMAAAREGVRDPEARKRIASDLLDNALKEAESPETSPGAGLDALLEARPEDENFMLED